MKSILVIEDTPKNCEDCPVLLLRPKFNCGEYDWKNNIQNKVKFVCPLKPLPQKKEVEVNEIEDIMHVEYSIEDIYKNKYVADIRLATDKLISLGWNACIDELLGETE